VASHRFVLRYRGEGPKPDADVARVRALPGAAVVDSSDRMLVVEVATHPEPLRDLVAALPDWVMGPDQQYDVPDTRKKVERPPG
jgi:hypothetical protein